jgi:hypothetical protein
MADELDPILEARLRGALHGEADALPFTLRADTLRRVQTERRRARNMQRLSLMSAAAVVVVAVAGVFLTMNLRNNANVATSPSPSASVAPSAAASASASASIAPPPSPSSNVPAGLPGDAELLAFAPGSVELGRAQSDASAGPGSTTITGVANRTSVAIIAACVGDGPLEASQVNESGAETPLGEIGTGACDGKPGMLAWNPDQPSSHMPSVKVNFPGATSWVAILVDRSRVPQDETASPIPSDSLPSLNEMLGSTGGFGTEVASKEHAATDTPSSTAFGDIRVASALGVLVTCSGSGVQLSAGDAAGSSKTPMGDVICDGTVQALTWTRAQGPSSAETVWVDAQAGAAWRAVAFDASKALAPTTHTQPAVACGKADLKAKTPPTSALYQNGKPVATFSYFTSSWPGGSSDGVPSAPDKAIEVTGDPLVLRLSGDVCASAWTVSYGVPADGAPGMSSVGLLAIQQPEKGADNSTSKNRENRIDLARLPSGDWLIEIFISFPDGDGAAMTWVHVP